VFKRYFLDVSAMPTREAMLFLNSISMPLTASFPSWFWTSTNRFSEDLGIEGERELLTKWLKQSPAINSDFDLANYNALDFISQLGEYSLVRRLGLDKLIAPIHPALEFAIDLGIDSEDSEGLGSQFLRDSTAIKIPSIQNALMIAKHLVLHPNPLEIYEDKLRKAEQLVLLRKIVLDLTRVGSP
jgi:hypothetical protein